MSVQTSPTPPPAAEPPPPAGSEALVTEWTRAPWLEQDHDRLELPLWIALDLSRQGQIAWPEILYPAADDSYADYYPRASARFLAAREKAAALRASLAADSRPTHGVDG